MNDAAEVITLDPRSQVSLGVADEVIEGYRLRLADLQADTKVGYEAVKVGLRELQKLRTGVDKSRKDLNDGAQKYIKTVNTEAKRVQALIAAIEEPLKQRKLAVDDKIENDRIAAAAIEQARIDAQQKAEQEAIEKRQAEERKKLIEEQEAVRLEREKLEIKKRELEASRERVEAQQRAIKEEQEQAEQARQAEIRMEERRKEEEELKAKRLKEEAKAKKKAEAEAIARREENERLAEERKPDAEKLAAFAERIATLKQPKLKSDWANSILSELSVGLAKVVADIRSYLPAEKSADELFPH